MCGIYGVVNDKTGEASQTILAGLKKLEYRGYDSWGIAVITGSSKTIKVDKHIGKIGAASTGLPKSTVGIGHTRWATHGGVTDQNAHPHLDCSKKIAVIHNGIVENYQRLKEKLVSRGHLFHSETDTEVIAHLIEDRLKTTSLKEAVFSTFCSLVGSNAIAVLARSSGAIVICRNGSPLVIGIAKNEFYLGSDVTAFLKKTNQVYFVKDREGVILTKNGVRVFDLKSKKEKKLVIETLDWKTEDAEKGGYPHFLLKEIVEQKKTIPKIAAINEDRIKKLTKLAPGYKIILSGCGSASYCTAAAKYFFAKVGINTEVYGAYEFLPFAKSCNQKTIFLAVSQSGETADTLIAAQAAKKNGALIVGVVNARGSTLERLADMVLPVGAGPEIAVVSTKAFTAQLASLYLLAQSIGGHYLFGKKQLEKLGKSLESWLSDKLFKKIIDLAKNLMDQQDIYLIGKYLNYPVALEFALKIKETSYIHAEAFASGELKHGVITLIQSGTPALVLFDNDKIKAEVLSSATELKARGGKIVGVGPTFEKEFDIHIQTPDVGELTIFPNIIVGQLLGYYLGVGRGADPDKPRNLAKSVTVK